MNIPSLPSGASVGINPANITVLGTFQGSVTAEVPGLNTITAVVNEHHSSGQAMSYNGF